MREFEAEVVAEGEGGAWPVIRIPFSVEEAFGTKARVAVAGTLNGHPYRTSLFPSGGGNHVMMLNKEMRAGAKLAVGDVVKVTMELDTGPREVAVPDDLRAALAEAGQLETFEKMTYSNRKFCVDGIEGAKKAETRASRIQKAVETVAQGKKFM